VAIGALTPCILVRD